MRDIFREYMSELLKDVPKTRRILELKEELISNMNERYQDLILEGFEAEDAIQSVIDSMGDVLSLFHDLEYESIEIERELRMESDEIRRKRAWITSISVGLYVFSFVVMVFVMSLVSMGLWPEEMGMMGFLGMILIAIVPTCMLVYSSHMYPKYKQRKRTVAEEFKDWQQEEKLRKQRKKARTMMHWLLTLIIYFGVSFASDGWEVTWIIFLISACIQAAMVFFGASRELSDRKE